MYKSTKPLEGMKFVLDGKFSVSKSVLTDKINKLGGEVTSSVTEKTAAVITTSGMLGAYVLYFILI